MKSKHHKILNGLWKYIPDTEEKLTFSDIECIYSERVLPEMRVPSNWELEGLYDFNGSVWFIKKFNVNNSRDDLKILKLNGADYFTEAWLNKSYLGKHEGYFQPFFFNITNLIKQENLLVLKVTSPFEEPGKTWPLKKKLIKGIFNHHDCRPGGWDLQKGQDKNTGGIWNNVEIKSGFPTYLSNIKISSQLNKDSAKATLVFKINFVSQSTKFFFSEIKINITSPSGLLTQKSFGVNFNISTNEIILIVEINNPELWWSADLGNPALYKIQISSEAFEEHNLSFGIREVMLDEHQQFFINGKRLFLRGTNLIPAQFLSELSKEKIFRIVKLIKDANINIVRVHAHVNRKELYEEFDRQGILVWQDFALQWTYDDSPEFISNAVSQIKDMVNLLYNYSSICFWCCHNEPGDQIHTLDPLLEQAVLHEDLTRIVRIASNYEEHPYDGWYWGTKEHFAAAPMGPLVTEFGAQALPDLQSLEKIFYEDEIFPPDWAKWTYHNFQPDQTFNIAKVEIGNNINSFIFNSQTYQADLLKTAVEFYRRKKFKGITGIFQFMFIDCWPSITWSVVDYFENPKPGYEILKNVYQPLFISINARQDQYYPGKKMLLDLYIINDQHKEFTDCSLHFYLGDDELYSINKINIDADEIHFTNYEDINVVLPDTISIGEHELKINLIHNNRSISQNKLSFKIVERLR